MRPSGPLTARRSGLGAILAGNAGNVLEWYDFVVFAFVAPSIAQQFFPATDPLAGLVRTFGVFAAGYLVRPLGGIVIGSIGDRLGRRRALQISMALMAVPTTLMAVLPGHAMLGLLAPILLVALRLAQGVSVGGEMVGSICYLFEIAPRRRRALYGSLTVLGLASGVLLASAAVGAARAILAPEAFAAWGWRLPFLGGLAIGALGWWMRRGLTETGEFETARARGVTAQSPLAAALRRQRRSLAEIGGLTAVIAVTFYTVFVWMPTYQMHIVRPPVPHALLINSGAMLGLIAAMPIAGAIADRVGARRVLLASALAYVVIAVPLFRLIDTGRGAAVLAATALFVAVHAGLNGPEPAVVAERLPTSVRFTGLALAYNLAFALFGGTAPLVATSLIASTGDLAAPAWYVSAVAAAGSVLLWRLGPPSGDPGDGVEIGATGSGTPRSG